MLKQGNAEMETYGSRKLAQRFYPKEKVSRPHDVSGKNNIVCGSFNQVKLSNTNITRQYQTETSVFKYTKKILTAQRAFSGYYFGTYFFEKLHLTKVIEKFSINRNRPPQFKQAIRRSSGNEQQKHHLKVNNFNPGSPLQLKQPIHISSRNEQQKHNLKVNNSKPYSPPQLKQPIHRSSGNEKQKHNPKPDSPPLMLDVIQRVSDDFCGNLNGNLDSISTKELNGGARIQKVFKETNTILEQINPLTGLTKKEILTTVLNAHGICMSRYIPKEAFEFLIKKQIEQLRAPCLNSVDNVKNELDRIIKMIIQDPKLQLHIYPKMQEELSTVALGLLERHLPTTKTMVNHILNIHFAYINYNHPLLFPLNDISPGEMIVETCDSNRVYTSIKQCIETYFSIVRNTIKNILPNIIVCYLVNTVMEELYLELVNRLKQGEQNDLSPTSPKCLHKRLNHKAILDKSDSTFNSQNPTNNPTCNSKPQESSCNSGTEQPSLKKRWVFKYLINLMILFIFMMIAYTYLLHK